jgi:hypothetical protein
MKSDVNKLVVAKGQAGGTVVRVYDGTGASDNDLLIQFTLNQEARGRLILALLKN